MSQNTGFQNYRQLLQKIDQSFNGIATRHPDQMQCAQGCFGCCRSGLTTTHLEAKHIRSWLLDHPEVVKAQQEVDSQAIHGPEFCSMLNERGGCSIYPVRPVICRSHGAPLLIPDSEDPTILNGDVCPLNFSTEDTLSKLPSGDWIRIDTLNAILAALDIEFDRERAGERRFLHLKSLLEP